MVSSLDCYPSRRLEALSRIILSSEHPFSDLMASCFTSSGGVQEARDRFATILLVPGISPRTNLTVPPLTLIRRFERYSKMEEVREETTFRLRVHEQRG